MPIDKGGQAFPSSGPSGGHFGMELWHYYAGQALEGLINKRTEYAHLGELASECFWAADAMIAEIRRREKQE